jgi:hypothetical protein
MKEIVNFCMSHLLPVTLLMGAMAFLAAWLTQRLSPVRAAGPQVSNKREPRRRLWACTGLIMFALWNLLLLCFDLKSAQIEDSAFVEPAFLIACRYSMIVCLGYAALAEYRPLPDLSWRSGIVLILGLGFAGVGTVMIAQL